MEWAKFILIDFIVPLAWPITLLFFVLIFRKPLVGFMERITEAGPGGVKAIAPSHLQEKPSDAVEKRLSDRPLSDDPDVKLWEDIILREIEQAGVKGLPDYSDRLIRALAYSNRRADFEQVGRLIYGTQVAALKQINDDGPQTEKQLTEWFDVHKKRSGGALYKSFDEWVHFLMFYALVITKEGKFEITVQGTYLLDFFHQNGINAGKPF